MQSRGIQLLGVLLITGIVIACNPLFNSSNVSQDIQDIYDENCAGCHGTQLQTFLKRLKSYDKSVEALTNMIKVGEEKFRNACLWTNVHR